MVHCLACANLLLDFLFTPTSLSACTYITSTLLEWLRILSVWAPGKVVPSSKRFIFNIFFCYPCLFIFYLFFYLYIYWGHITCLCWPKQNQHLCNSLFTQDHSICGRTQHLYSSPLIFYMVKLGPREAGVCPRPMVTMYKTHSQI